MAKVKFFIEKSGENANCSKMNIFSPKKAKVFIYLLFAAINLCGQVKPDSTSTFYFKQRDFAKYFISDIYSPTPQIHAGYGFSIKEYNLSPERGQRFYILYNETNFASEIPVFTKNKYGEGKIKSKLSLSIPISASVLFDFTEVTTAPIINTDYRFAPMEFNYLRVINHKYIKNYSIKFVPFFHESTHIGDELTLFRVQDSFPIVRINVTYEAAELALTINDTNGKLNKNTSFKAGIKCLLNPKKGWYSMRPTEGDTSIVNSTTHWIESYLQIQTQTNKGWLASNKFLRIFSVEFRNRVQFGYPYFFEDFADPKKLKEYANNERMILSTNAYFGWKWNISKSEIPRFGSYFKTYIGVNPYGQFRNIPFYNYFGISFVYEN